MLTRRYALSLFAITLAVSPLASFANGDVVNYIEAKEINNPPPSMALGAFDRIEVTPLTMVAPYAGQPANEEAMKRIQANLDERMNPLVAEWNGAAAKSSPPKTLKVEPVIRHIKFVSGKA